MLGSQTNSKKLLITKTKLTSQAGAINTTDVMKKYKSQDVYLVAKKKSESKPVKEGPQSPEITPTNIGNRNSKNMHNLNLNTYSNINFFKSKQLGNLHTNSSKTPTQAERRNNFSPESGKTPSKMNSYKINKPKPVQNTPIANKIMNDESIQELDTEENINSLDENDEKQMDEMKSLDGIKDFYTQSMGETSAIIDKEKKLINNIPQPFVKPFKTKFVNINLNIELENENISKSSNSQSPQKEFSKREQGKLNPETMKESVSTKVETMEKTITLQNDTNEDTTSVISLQKKLLASSKKGDRDLVLECLESILCNSNGDINFKDENGLTALHHACDEGNLKIVDILLNTNADVNSKTNCNKSPLHLAVSHGYFDISKKLIENGGLINSLDEEKNTPIHICSTIGHLELLKYLLERFPQADTKNIHGQTPIDLAKKDDIKALLQEYLKKNESQYHKVHIHTINNKSANILLKNLNSGYKLNNNQNINNYLHTKGGNTNNKTPIKTTNHAGTGNIASSVNKNQLEYTKINSKFQLNNNDKTNNQDNIEIKINTNNKSSGGVNINVTNDLSNTNKIKLNEKVNVGVETKVDNNRLTSNSNTKQTSNSKGLTHASTSVKFNTVKTNNYVTNRSHSKFNVASKVQNNNQLATNANKISTETNTSRNTNSNKKEEENNPNDNNIKKDEATSINKNTLRGFSPKVNKNKIPVIDLSDNNQLIDNLEEEQTNQIIGGINNNDNSNSLSDESCQINSLEEEPIGPNTFICHALLGKGSFGQVYLVEKRNTKTLYAMKVLSKDKIMGQNLIKYAMTERNVLSITNHPFIVKLNYSFQTSDKLFLILDYCPGGDLAEHLNRENRFSEQVSKIYLCEIILALEDLHKRDIIFRDLKPDNVVLDFQGHAQLTDFGLSKEGVLDSKSAKSFCGSIAYLAPEMLKRTGHGKAVDWYLLGVLFYEMLIGIPPYFTNNKEQLFKNIQNAELQIPKFISEDAASLLRALLERDPQQRLGAGEDDANEIKQHRYFKNVNWDDVYNRKLKPPTPIFKNKAIQHYNQPQVFQDNSAGIFSIESSLENHFDGWSFINTKEQTLENSKQK